MGNRVQNSTGKIINIHACARSDCKKCARHL